MTGLRIHQLKLLVDTFANYFYGIVTQLVSIKKLLQIGRVLLDKNFLFGLFRMAA